MAKCLVFVFVLVATTTTLAHHGGNLYDTAHVVTMKDATITKFEWGTPHNQIYFDVKNDKGEIVHWVGSTEPAGVMIECGWTRRSLKPGDQTTIEIFAAKNGAPVGNLQKVTFPDGKVLEAGFGCAESAKKEGGR
jgi:hypothetical protein